VFYLARLLALLANIELGQKGLPRPKHSSLLRKLVNYGRKKFYNIGPWHTNVRIARKGLQGPNTVAYLSFASVTEKKVLKD
jgi:hypothetical protein